MASQKKKLELSQTVEKLDITIFWILFMKNNKVYKTQELD